MVCSAERSVGRKVLSQAVVISRYALSQFTETRTERNTQILISISVTRTHAATLPSPRSRAMSSYPEHLVVPMPALSPTMETGRPHHPVLYTAADCFNGNNSLSLLCGVQLGSIVGWNIKEGQRFEAGDAICEVETDKATVAYEGIGWLLAADVLRFLASSSNVYCIAPVVLVCLFLVLTLAYCSYSD